MAIDAAPRGRILQVNVSLGGVPKLPVPAARITALGITGDRQKAATVHGGPHRAVCILGIDAIRRVEAEGHPIAPGSTGENLTVEGFDVSTFPPGTRLRIGERVVLELSAPTAPCETIRHSFTGGRFARLGIARHPQDARMYARVITEGEVRPGDPIAVTPPLDDAADLHILAVELDQAEASWSRALWRAAGENGETVHVIADGDLSIAAAPELPHPSFNSALGLVMLPHHAPMATRHFDRHNVSGWLLADAAPIPNLTLSWPLGRHVIEPREIRHDAPSAEVEIRELDRDEVGQWSAVVAAASEMDGSIARAWAAAERGLAEAGHHHRFVAYLDGVPAGAASLHTHHGVGWLCAGSVLAEARGKGVQRQLIAARAERAVALGCQVIGASAVDGGASEANLARMGFRRVATRNAYRYDPSSA